MESADNPFSDRSTSAPAESAQPANTEPQASLAEAIQPAPSVSAPAAPLMPAASEAPSPVAIVAHGLWNLVLPLLFFLSIVVLIAYAAPFLIMHWRLTEAQAE